MTDDDWTEGFLGYADEGNVEIVFIDSPAEVLPREVWHVTLFDEPGDPDEAARALLRFGQDFEGETPFLLDVKRNYFSWGADAAAWTVVVTFASGVLTGLAQDLVKDRIKRALSQMTGGASEVEAADREAALDAALWAVVRRYDVERHALELKAEEENQRDGTWVFTFRDPAQYTYTVEVGVIQGALSSHRIRRAVPEPGPPLGGTSPEGIEE